MFLLLGDSQVSKGEIFWCYIIRLRAIGENTKEAERREKGLVGRSSTKNIGKERQGRKEWSDMK